MANIRKIDGKNGVSYKIAVTQGRDLSGKQIRHYMTWTPPHKMTERQMQKAVEVAAIEFEKSIALGYQADNRQTFAEYATYVLDLKEREGAKYRTLERYQELMQRINPAIGHIKLQELRPQHLNAFYKNLAEPGICKQKSHAQAKVDLVALFKKQKLTRAKVAELSGISATTITTACQKKQIALATAEAIAKALGHDVADLFEVETAQTQLSNKTILEHHRLIHTILSQAEKEMLVQYNAAAKATPPKAAKKEVNYFQPDDIVKIRDALDKEPLKWKVATHLLLITGCRRGEVMGLRWDRVDFANSKIKMTQTFSTPPSVEFMRTPPKPTPCDLSNFPRKPWSYCGNTAVGIWN